MKLTIFLGLILVAAARVHGEPLVSQEIHRAYGLAADGSGRGQSFYLPQGSTIDAIQLYLFEGTETVKVNLWGDAYRSEGHPLRVTNFVSADTIRGSGDAWYSFILEEPYTVTAPGGQTLIFDIELEREGGLYVLGFDDDLYDGGSSVIWRDDHYDTLPNTDLAFRISNDAPLVIPVPVVEFSFESASPGRLASSEVLIRESVVGYEYTCFMSEDLNLPRDQWDEMWTEVGYGGPVNWGVGYGTAPSSHFFFVEVKAAQ